MIPILSPEQIKAWDAFTIAQEPIASIDLMERASRAWVTWFTERFHALHRVAIVCGTGNNGGDGLAIARMLKDWGYPIQVYIVHSASPATPDFQTNLTRLSAVGITPVTWQEGADIPALEGHQIIVDALFGIGLSRPLTGIYATAVDRINAADAVRVAVDVPSGLMLQQASTGAIVQADYTLTFQQPKLPFFFPQYHAYVGQWFVLDIGLHKKYISTIECPHQALTQKSIRRLLRPRGQFDHKGTYGHAWIIAGSRGKMGACILAARAALRSGVGLLTVHVPQGQDGVIHTTVPEAMVSADQHPDCWSAMPDVEASSALGIGPGLGRDPQTAKALFALLTAYRRPLVLDADALNLLAEHRHNLHLVPAGSILTPHPKEFQRLVGAWKDDFERLAKQQQLARQLQSVVILKGAYTAIATPDGRVYFNTTGNPGMATGGTGDVLTGILTALLAQGYPAETSAIVGVFLHGWAGDLAAREKSMTSLVASDVIEALSEAFRQAER